MGASNKIVSRVHLCIGYGYLKKSEGHKRSERVGLVRCFLAYACRTAYCAVLLCYIGNEQPAKVFSTADERVHVSWYSYKRNMTDIISHNRRCHRPTKSHGLFNVVE